MSKRKETIIISVIIALQVSFLFVIFVLFKQGIHSDEIWNYAFANSYESKELYVSNEGDSLLNQWRESDVFFHYISVEKSHRFNYKNVIDNVSMDQNPPLQYLVLHTICSFFPERFSWYFCFSINIFSFVITQYYLYFLSKNITNNKWCGLATMFLYGFGTGAMNIAIFLRIYALAIMFMVMFAYYSHMVYAGVKEKEIKKKNLIGVGITCFLGAYTLHLFLFIAFIITFIYVLYYLVTKHIKPLLAHGFICLGAAVLSILAYPSFFRHLFGPKEAHNYSFVKFPTPMQNRFYFYYLTRDLFGIHISPFPNPYLEWILIALGCIVILVIPFVFVFRKDEWFRGLILSVKSRIKEICKKTKNISVTLLSYLLATIIMVLVAGDRTSIYLMKTFSSRYLFIIYPLAAIFASCTLYYIVYLLSTKRRIATILTAGLCAVCAIWSHLEYGSYDYLLVEPKSGKICKDLETNANSVIVLKDDWILTLFAPRLYHTNSYYATDYLSEVNKDLFAEIDTNMPCYLIVNRFLLLDEDTDYKELEEDPMFGSWAGIIKHEEDFLAPYLELKEVEDIKKVGMETMMNQEFWIYEITFKQLD